MGGSKTPPFVSIWENDESPEPTQAVEATAAAAEVEALRADLAAMWRMPDLTVVEVARLALRVGVRRLAAEVVRDAGN
jgi:hypothetical protein